MEIFRSLEQVTPTPQGRSVVTIGVFDGVHCAHQALLQRVRELAAQEEATSVAITFDPHPLTVLAPQKMPKLLTPTPLKLELLQKAGMDRVLLLPFTEEFSHWPPERFVEDVLLKTLRAKSAVVGENFRFGYRAAGTPAMLAKSGAQRGFRTEVLPSLRVRGMRVSSSEIRKLLEAGKLSRANRLLGRPFAIRNPIEAGQGIGRVHTVPTLNLAPYSDILPANGVYITWARPGMEPQESAEEAAVSEGMPIQAASRTGALESAAAGTQDDLSKEKMEIRIESLSRAFRSVTNVGVRPTFGERGLGVETHLLENWQGAPPTTLEVSFLYRLRDERKFASPEELKQQILKDIRRAESYFRRLENCGARRI